MNESQIRYLLNARSEWNTGIYKSNVIRYESDTRDFKATAQKTVDAIYATSIDISYKKIISQIISFIMSDGNDISYPFETIFVSSNTYILTIDSWWINLTMRIVDIDDENIKAAVALMPIVKPNHTKSANTVCKT